LVGRVEKDITMASGSFDDPLPDLYSLAPREAQSSLRAFCPFFPKQFTMHDAGDRVSVRSDEHVSNFVGDKRIRGASY